MGTGIYIFPKAFVLKKYDTPRLPSVSRNLVNGTKLVGITRVVTFICVNSSIEERKNL